MTHENLPITKERLTTNKQSENASFLHKVKIKAPIIAVVEMLFNSNSGEAERQAVRPLVSFPGHYAQDTCVYGPGDLPWIIQSPCLFAHKFEASADPLVVTCLERRHRLKVLRQAEVPVEPHWHFQEESPFNMRLDC